jgi:hypothetical protein
MKKTDIYKYYSFGFNYNILKRTDSEETYENLINNVNDYLEFINDLDLRVTNEVLELKKFHKVFDAILENVKSKPELKSRKVEIGQITKLTEIIELADATLDAELSIRVAYILDDKRISNEILFDYPSKLFANGVFNDLPSVARQDFEESCKCLAFDRYTACAFHALRGTEDVIKYYYEKLTSKTSNESQTWYSFIDEIKKMNTTLKVKEEIFINLDYLRKFYRNKTQHPLLIYSSDDSQDLLLHCIKSVNEVLKDLKLRKLI